MTAQLYNLAKKISIHALQTECNNPSALANSIVIVISIHALQTECNQFRELFQVLNMVFQSMHSRRSATHIFRPRNRPIEISIHALQTECNNEPFGGQEVIPNISIHALQTECNACYTFSIKWCNKFQSMHSRRSATTYPGGCSPCPTDFNPCTPDGVQRKGAQFIPKIRTISIHALQTECNKWLEEWDVTMGISIHALQTECNSSISSTSSASDISIHALQTECNTLMTSCTPR